LTSPTNKLEHVLGEIDPAIDAGSRAGICGAACAVHAFDRAPFSRAR
jgi:hypothetical protein